MSIPSVCRARKFPASKPSILLLVLVLAMHAASGSSQAAEPDGEGNANQGADFPFPKHVKAPSLEGGVAWMNTGGPLDLKQLRGKFVVLDFWTYCCINCMHILPVLKKLEHAYPNEIVVIGVHSAKFDTEQDSESITKAVLRYEIEHPVVNDAKHVIWNKFAVNSWPSLRIIDPAGNLVAANSGEIDFDTLDQWFKKYLPYYKEKGLLNPAPLKFDLERQNAAQTPLRFPGKILADEKSDRLFIADSNHNRIVVTRLDGTLLATIGSGAIGRTDGDYASARFDHPQGMTLDGETLYVADTENHMLRKVDLKQQKVATVAGLGTQGATWPGGPDRWIGKPAETALNSPWALWIHQKNLYIAMAGFHQIWKMPLDESEIGPYAGNSVEDIVDGALLSKRPYETGGYSSFAQPSGLTSDGTSLFVADSEGSSIRIVPFSAKNKVHTMLGTASQAHGRLFTFGDVDGKGRQVRFQHPLDVAWHDGRLYVCDTYNSKIKVVDPAQRSAKALAGTGNPGSDELAQIKEATQLNEPAGLSAAGNKLFVADTNNHLIRTIDLKDGNRVATLKIPGLAAPAGEPAAKKPD